VIKPTILSCGHMEHGLKKVPGHKSNFVSAKGAEGVFFFFFPGINNFQLKYLIGARVQLLER
jgi:hypothetical protein